ncbi:MAG: hypothetical protein OXK78_15780 [Caldilineaceae bacterium]|nr:hypothetical protein [Caldilineaceae bacterium]
MSRGRPKCGGHPDPGVLEILGGRLVLRNDREGRVHMWSDGQLIWIGMEQGNGSEGIYGR